MTDWKLLKVRKNQLEQGRSSLNLLVYLLLGRSASYIFNDITMKGKNNFVVNKCKEYQMSQHFSYKLLSIWNCTLFLFCLSQEPVLCWFGFAMPVFGRLKCLWCNFACSYLQTEDYRGRSLLFHRLKVTQEYAVYLWSHFTSDVRTSLTFLTWLFNASETWREIIHFHTVVHKTSLFVCFRPLSFGEGWMSFCIILNELSISLGWCVLQNMHRIIFANSKESFMEKTGCLCSK